MQSIGDPNATASQDFWINVPKSRNLVPGASYDKFLPGEIRVALRRAGLQGKAILMAKSSQVHWKGRFRNGWDADSSYSGTAGFGYLMLSNREPHAVHVEMGRRAGAKPPPVSAILEWVLDKLGGGRKEAFAVAKAIGRRGIKPRRVMTETNTRGDLLVILWRELDRAADRAALKSLRKVKP